MLWLINYSEHGVISDIVHFVLVNTVIFYYDLARPCWLQHLKPGYIEFGVVCIHSATGIQPLLTRRVSYC